MSDPKPYCRPKMVSSHEIVAVSGAYLIALESVIRISRKAISPMSPTPHELRKELSPAIKVVDELVTD